MKKTLLFIGATLTTISTFALDIAEAEKFVTENKCKNLIANGNFELFGKAGNIPQWWPWKAKNSNGAIVWDQREGIDDSGAAILCSGDIVMMQDVQAKEGETYLVVVMAKKSIDAALANLSFRFKTNRQWHPSAKSISKQVVFDKKDSWVKCVNLVTIPQGADSFCVMLSASNLVGEDAQVAFDNVEVYKVK